MGVKEWLVYVFSSYLSVPVMAIAFSAALILTSIVVMVSTGIWSDMSRFNRAHRSCKKFFTKQSVVKSDNLNLFKKKCVAKLPKSVRESWIKFETGSQPLQKTDIKAVMADSFNKGGTNGFIIFLFMFLAMTALLLISMGIGGNYGNINAICLCVTLMLGVFLIIVQALQLYYMDKKHSGKVEEIYETIVARMLINKEMAVVECLHSSRADDFESLAKTMEVEKKLKEGYTSLEGMNIDRIINTAEVSDSFCELENMVDTILASDVSRDTLNLIRQSILAVSKTEYARPLDELRLKGILRKLEA